MRFDTIEGHGGPAKTVGAMYESVDSTVSEMHVAEMIKCGT